MPKRTRWKKEAIEELSKLINVKHNYELANYFNTTIPSISQILVRNNIRRDPLVREKTRIETLNKLREKYSHNGENNPNWKGGISKNNYHYKKIQVERYPERVIARQKVYDAVQSGKLIKKPCEICGSLEVQAHHDDYLKPLEVRWFCKKHHRYHIHNGKH